MQKGIYLTAALGLTMASAHAATIIQSHEDTYIRSSIQYSASNFNSDAFMVANDQELTGGTVRMAVFSFDLSTHIGSITSAKLELTDNTGNNNASFDIYGLTDAAEDFDETTLTWDTAGFLSGTDVDETKGTLLGSFSNTQNSRNTVFDVTSGPFLNFLNNSVNNIVTFVIVDPDLGLGPGSGWAVHEDGTAANRPTLTAIPEPASAALLIGLGGLALALRRRR
jgi:hypothetical protein